MPQCHSPQFIVYLYLIIKYLRQLEASLQKMMPTHINLWQNLRVKIGSRGGEFDKQTDKVEFFLLLPVLQCHPQGLQSSDVPGQLEYPANVTNWTTEILYSILYCISLVWKFANCQLKNRFKLFFEHLVLTEKTLVINVFSLLSLSVDILCIPEVNVQLTDGRGWYKR